MFRSNSHSISLWSRTWLCSSCLVRSSCSSSRYVTIWLISTCGWVSPGSATWSALLVSFTPSLTPCQYSGSIRISMERCSSQSTSCDHQDSSTEERATSCQALQSLQAYPSSSCRKLTRCSKSRCIDEWQSSFRSSSASWEYSCMWCVIESRLHGTRTISCLQTPLPKVPFTAIKETTFDIAELEI